MGFFWGDGMTSRSIVAKDLTQVFGEGFKLGPLDFELDGGSTVGIVGHNGAGKTTLFELLTGNRYPTSGKLTLSGKKLGPDRTDLKRQIGYLPQNLSFPKWVSPYDLLDYTSRLHGLPAREDRLQSALETWQCTSYAHKPLASCSHGMQKRAALAVATIHNPAFLVLDEPFSGLDISHIKSLTDLIRERNEQGLATILSTHMLLYVAKLCNAAYLVHHGSLQRVQPWADLAMEKRADNLEGLFFEKLFAPESGCQRDNPS